MPILSHRPAGPVSQCKKDLRLANLFAKKEAPGSIFGPNGGPHFACLIFLLLIILTIDHLIFCHPCFSLKVATDLRVEGEKIPEKVFLFCSSEQVIVCFATTLCCCERMLKRVFPYAKSLKLPNTSLGKPANIIFAEFQQCLNCLCF